MEYQEFKLKVREELEKILGKDFEIIVQEVERPNDVKVEVLRIVEKEKDYIAPLCYLEELYLTYKENIKECIEDILSFFSREKVEAVDYISKKLYDWEYVKNNIYVRLYNTKQNIKFLQNLVTEPLQDLSVAVYIKIQFPDGEHGTVWVTKEMIKLWETTEEDLLTQAKDNLKKQDYQIRKIEEVMGDLGVIVESDTSEVGLYVLTNKDKEYGAAGILLGKEFFQKIFGAQTLYILPSSIHECATRFAA